MPLPEKFGRYKIISELGRGGMATVYRAFDPNFDREVAIKALPREMMHDPQFRSRFEREIKMVAQLGHPSIVPVYDTGEVDGQPYFVMRFMTGGSLSDRIEKGGIPIEETARIIGKIAQGLAYAHRKGVIHRDLKPDNILFDENGEPFISDFGVAKLIESAGNLTGSGVIGTPAYMSPEQAQGVEIDKRSDVYGLGVIVYQMLTGHQPYSADTPMGVVVKHITEPVPEILKVLPNLPPDVDAVIKTAMAKDKTSRYENTIELAKALNTIAFGDPGNITYHSNTGMTPRAKNQPLSRGQTTGAAAAGVILALAVAGFFLLRNQLFSSESPTTTVDAPTPSVSREPAFTTAPVSPTLEGATEAASSFAPACPASVAFPTPTGKETNNICKQKIPYAFAAMKDTADFTVLNSSTAGSKCRAEADNNGEKVISCTGPSFAVVELEICEIPKLSEQDLAQCSADSTYNAENQCCLALPPKKAACKTIKIQLKGCGG